MSNKAVWIDVAAHGTYIRTKTYVRSCEIGSSLMLKAFVWIKAVASVKKKSINALFSFTRAQRVYSNHLIEVPRDSS